MEHNFRENIRVGFVELSRNFSHRNAKLLLVLCVLYEASRYDCRNKVGLRLNFYVIADVSSKVRCRIYENITVSFIRFMKYNLLHNFLGPEQICFLGNNINSLDK